jgi:hypothetical protein
MTAKMSGAVGSVAAVLLTAASFGWAQIERLDLAHMVARTDNAVLGKIVGKEVIRVDSPLDGPELYFTHLLVEGRSLYSGNQISVPVTFAGGFVRPGEGVWNSEAPTADDTQLGNQVVVFYKWTDNMGGDVAANALYAAHGGLYRVIEGRKEQIVLGRGDGYAIDKNITVTDLGAAIAKLR